MLFINKKAQDLQRLLNRKHYCAVYILRDETKDKSKKNRINEDSKCSEFNLLDIYEQHYPILVLLGCNLVKE